ncbi:MAG: uncharacterized protein JWL77_1946 [Chthonomonadaceae bacterium]|nr:uncharacterized protein [Chthonomonadaceae bacterium]
MSRVKVALVVAVMLIPMFCYSQAMRPNYQPKDGFVPDAATAIAIAQAVWIPIYGRKQIEHEKPFKASLHNGIWWVEGSLPKGMHGGVAVAEISKKDGRILGVIHGK